MIYDLIIIGGGPAGVAGGVYASRKRLRTLFITETFGGQSVVSDGIENWIGTVKISGADLAKALETHLRAYAKDIVDIKTGVRVVSIDKSPTTDVDGAGADGIAGSTIFVVNTTDGAQNKAKAILVATGSHRRRLEAIGADKYEHKGLTYCASCDGPLFSDQDVVVIGGGNSAFESAAQLSAYCKSVTILHRSPSFRADPVTVKKVSSDPKVRIIVNAEVLEVHGDKFVNGISYKEKDSGAIKKLEVAGIFVEIGSIPTTDFVKNLVELDQYNRVIINHKNQQASCPGIWSAGDCTDVLYHQNNIATGDAVKALEDIYVHLKAR